MHEDAIHPFRVPVHEYRALEDFPAPPDRPGRKKAGQLSDTQKLAVVLTAASREGWEPFQMDSLRSVTADLLRRVIGSIDMPFGPLAQVAPEPASEALDETPAE